MRRVNIKCCRKYVIIIKFVEIYEKQKPLSFIFYCYDSQMLLTKIKKKIQLHKSSL